MDVLIQTLMYVEVSNIMECNPGQHIPGAAFKSLSQIPANQTFKVSHELNSYEPNFYVVVQKVHKEIEFDGETNACVRQREATGA